MRKFLFIVGLLIFALAFCLAFIYQYKHFYEFLLIGLFLILYDLIPEKTVNIKQYFFIYLLFVPFGLIADLFLGLNIAELWYYNYNFFWEYLILYLLIYPLGGITMVQSYLFLKTKFGCKPEKKKINIKLLKLVALIFLGISLLLFLFYCLFYSQKLGMLFYGSSALTVFFAFNYQSEKWSRESYVGDLFSNFRLFLFISLATAYLNAFIHEFPNTFAHQWVYINWPFNELTLLGIPVIVFFVGWIFLTIIPVSAYYWAVVRLNSKKIN